MDAISYVIRQQNACLRVSLCRDCYGNHWADISRGWMRPIHEKVELSREEYEWLRHEIRKHVDAGGGPPRGAHAIAQAFGFKRMLSL